MKIDVILDVYKIAQIKNLWQHESEKQLQH